MDAECSPDAAVEVAFSIARFGSLPDWLGAAVSCDPLERWTNNSTQRLARFIFASARPASSACSGGTMPSVLRLNAAMIQQSGPSSEPLTLRNPLLYKIERLLLALALEVLLQHCCLRITQDRKMQREGLHCADTRAAAE